MPLGEHRVAWTPQQQRRHVGRASAVRPPRRPAWACSDGRPRAGCRRRSRRPPAAAAPRAVRRGQRVAGPASERAGLDTAVGPARRPAWSRTPSAAGRRTGPAGSVPGAAGRACATPVLVSTMPASWVPRWRSAQPRPIGPPQSWATRTTGPVSIPSAAVSRSRSSMRCAIRRGPARAARTSPCRAGRGRRRASPGRGGEEAPPQVGPGRVAVHAEHGAAVGSTPLSRRCQRRGIPSASATSTRRDQAGSRSGSPAGRSRERCGARSRVRAGTHQAISAYEVFSPEPIPSSSTRSPAREAVDVLGQGERHGGRGHVAEIGQRDREPRRMDPEGRGHGLDVDHRGLVRDEPVDPVPAEVVLGVVPGVEGERQTRRRTAPCCRCASRSGRRRTGRGVRCRPG